MDVERAILCKIVETGDFISVLDAHIQSSYFLDDEHRQVFVWFLDHWDKWHRPPSTDALHHEFPNYKLMETPDPIEYYIEEVRKERSYSLTMEVVEEAAKRLKGYDPDTALHYLAGGVERIYAEIPTQTDEDITKTGERRLAYYDSLKDLPNGLLGIPTGFATLDKATSGLQKEQLITIQGITKGGKSVILMVMAITAHALGFKPMLVTFEMSNAEQAARHDAFRAHISHNRLTTGKLHKSERRRLERMISEVESLDNSIVFVHDPTSTTTVSALASKVVQHKPDLLLVDGVYMMTCDDPKLDPGTPQGLTSITRSMKRLAQRARIPIVQTTQALAWKYSKKQGLNLNTIGYSSSFGQDSDVVLGVEQPTDNDREALVRIVAARNSSQRQIRISWDWEHGTFQEMEEEFEFESTDDTDL